MRRTRLVLIVICSLIATTFSVALGIAQPDPKHDDDKPTDFSGYGIETLRIIAHDMERDMRDLRRQLATSDAKAKNLEERLTKANKKNQDLNSEVKKLQLASTGKTQRISTLQDELEETRKQLRQWKPGDSANGGDVVPELVTKQIETLGKEYAGKEVRLLDCTFGEVGTWHIKSLPGVTRYDIIVENEYEKWVSFRIRDKNGNYFECCFAKKADHGELVATLRPGARINIRGVVTRLPDPPLIGGQRIWYGLVCTSIELTSPAGKSVHEQPKAKD